jgi:hypothetical protein
VVATGDGPTPYGAPEVIRALAPVGDVIRTSSQVSWEGGGQGPALEITVVAASDDDAISRVHAALASAGVLPGPIGATLLPEG